MEEKEVQELCDEVKSLAKQVKTSLLHLNNLCLLCELCEENNDKVQYIALTETYQVFDHLIRTKTEYANAFVYKSITKKDNAKKQHKGDDNENDQITTFLQEKYRDYISIVFNHLHTKSSCLQVNIANLNIHLLFTNYKIIGTSIEDSSSICKIGTSKYVKN